MAEKDRIIMEIEKSIKENISNVFKNHKSNVPELDFAYTKIDFNFDKKLRRIQRTFKEDF